MNKQWVNELSPGQKVESIFAIGDITTARTKNDALYLRMKVYDRTGSMEARIWDEELASQCVERYADGGIVTIRAAIDSYNGQLQMIVRDIEPCEGECDLSLFLPSSPIPIEKLRLSLTKAIESVENAELRTFLSLQFSGEFMDKYCISPAAQGVHHAYLGGLVEHSLEVARFCLYFAREYPEMDKDLLITGALIHDIGKVHEYLVRPGFPIDDRARLIGGHIVLGRDLLRGTLAQISGFPPKLALALEHMLVSHHGIREWGALDEPSTLEAIALSQADLASARLNQAASLVRQAGDKEWSEYNVMLRRKLWIPDFTEPDLKF